MKVFPITKIFQNVIFMLYTYRNVQENHSLFGVDLDLSPGDKANSEPAATD